MPYTGKSLCWLLIRKTPGAELRVANLCDNWSLAYAEGEMMRDHGDCHSFHVVPTLPEVEIQRNIKLPA
jgi:hypothetical protein